MFLCVSFYTLQPSILYCWHLNAQNAVDVIQPTLSYPLLTTPICALIAINLLMHYYYACTVSPGFVDEPPREVGHGLLWARPRRKGHKVLTGVRWSEEGSIKITKATTTKCRKCVQIKPEVGMHRIERLWKLTTWTCFVRTFRGHTIVGYATVAFWRYVGAMFQIFSCPVEALYIEVRPSLSSESSNIHTH
jgi:hypothetical protein